MQANTIEIINCQTFSDGSLELRIIQYDNDCDGHYGEVWISASCKFVGGRNVSGITIQSANDLCRMLALINQSAFVGVAR